MSDATLQQLGRYRILGELGRGNMGVVYRAHDPMLDRTVAIKAVLLTGDAHERAAYEARFLQEARAAGRLSHTAIITIYDVGREGDLAYIAMEMLNGVDLRQRLAQERLPLRDAIGLTIQVAEGLGFAHEHGVVHRDIKPANIMVVRGERAKIMDFGIARLAMSTIKTQPGILLGTPKYMSPEQVAGHALDHRTDIFSLGAMFYEMVVGRAPYGGADTTQLMHAIANVPHAAPSQLRTDLPPLVDLIAARALEKDVKSRYQSANDFASDLKACLAELPDVSLVAPVDATEALLRDGTPTPRDVPAAAELTMTAERTRPPPADTAAFCPVSRRFDSAPALQRLAQLSAHDRARLTRASRRPGPVMRLLRDPDLRLCVGAVLASCAAAAAIALI